MRKQLTTLLAGVAVSVCTVGVTETAQAWSIVVDCKSTSGSSPTPSWASTTNRVKFQIKANNVWHDIRTYTNVGVNLCDGDNELVVPGDSTPESQLQAVGVRIDGDDAFWIDDIILSITGGFWRWGVDDNFGFTLSSDPADGNNAWSFGGSASQGIQFNAR